MGRRRPDEQVAVEPQDHQVRQVAHLGRNRGDEAVVAQAPAPARSREAGQQKSLCASHSAVSVAKRPTWQGTVPTSALSLTMLPCRRSVEHDTHRELTVASAPSSRRRKSESTPSVCTLCKTWHATRQLWGCVCLHRWWSASHTPKTLLALQFRPTPPLVLPLHASLAMKRGQSVALQPVRKKPREKKIFFFFLEPPTERVVERHQCRVLHGRQLSKCRRHKGNGEAAENHCKRHRARLMAFGTSIPTSDPPVHPFIDQSMCVHWMSDGVSQIDCSRGPDL